MCGRFTITTDKAKLAKRFKAQPKKDFPARFNAAPTQFLPIITEQEPDRIRLFRWGLTPSWLKKISRSQPLINVRAETLRDKPTFKKDFETKRCLVLADGFYEWQKIGKEKQPFWIGLEDRKPFAFAGIWEENLVGDEMRNSFAIITTESNKLLSDIHKRMPLILEPEFEQDWLSQETKPEKLLSLFKPYSGEALTYYPVSTQVNYANNDYPALIEHIN